MILTKIKIPFELKGIIFFSKNFPPLEGRRKFFEFLSGWFINPALSVLGSRRPKKLKPKT
ncbi:hypothetical protein IO89_01230 [Epilithonimonas lactis]|uniref:Uncharacterized protein n=1 Tax=Epilithonimonas lactis TaxID=421072 RepID=A0A085BL99_9FLAO|nr:hypothetical protein IO89_01230 [Epilithonimonas lactis]